MLNLALARTSPDINDQVPILCRKKCRCLQIYRSSLLQIFFFFIFSRTCPKKIINPDILLTEHATCTTLSQEKPPSTTKKKKKPHQKYISGLTRRVNYIAWLGSTTGSDRKDPRVLSFYGLSRSRDPERVEDRTAASSSDCRPRAGGAPGLSERALRNNTRGERSLPPSWRSNISRRSLARDPSQLSSNFASLSSSFERQKRSHSKREKKKR